MTLDEAIKHCEEVAEENDYSAVLFRQKKEVSRFLEKAEAENAENECRECAAEHRQLAEWLKELKERRKHTYIAPCGNCCKDCPYSLERVIENG